jgi:Zn-dependent peptidase ImmA (M78 family)
LAVYIADSVIETKALELLSRYSINNDCELAFPIPIDLIIETELAYNNSVKDLGDSAILGAISPLEKTIYTNERSEEKFKQFPGLYQFTLGHEVGHRVLHLNDSNDQLKLSEDFPYPFICRDTGSKPIIEIQADKFAAEVLMPKELMQQIVSDRDIYNWPALYKLRDEIGVSISALNIRLQQMGLLYIPKGTRDIYRSEAHANGQQNLFTFLNK